ncbi:hypothetical protein J7J83_03685 [bacterium]|nr:hypothetical protein [bacterium]
METKIPQINKRQRTKFTPSVVLNIVLIVGVLMIVAFVLYVPRTDFFKGAVLLGTKSETNTTPGAILIDYVTKDSNVNDDLNTLTSLILNAKNEKIKIDSLLFEFDSGKIHDTKLLINGHEPSNVDYVWISKKRLLIDLSGSDVFVKDRLSVMLQGKVEFASPDQKITVILSDISAFGENNNIITNIGSIGKIDAVGTVLHIQK